MPASSLVTVVVPQPAAGVDWSYKVPAGFGLIVIAVSALLTDSGAAGNRTPMLQLVAPGGNLVGIFGINAALIVSQAARYVWGNGLPAAAAPVNSASSPSTYPLPQGIVVPVGGLIQVVTAGILAGDQWSDIVLTLGN